MVFCVFQLNRKTMSLFVRLCTFFIKWFFTKLHEMSSSKRPVSWPSWVMSYIDAASWFFVLILEELFSLVVLSRGSSLSDRSDARQECRDQKSVWQHPGYYWCKWNTVWRTTSQHIVHEACSLYPRTHEDNKHTASLSHPHNNCKHIKCCCCQSVFIHSSAPCFFVILLLLYLSGIWWGMGQQNSEREVSFA